VSRISEFLEDVDRQWKKGSESGKTRLRIIGSAALMLQTGYERGTKDSDVLETAALTADIKKRLISLAGAGTDLHERHRLYIDIVSSGLPFLPQSPRCHAVGDLNRKLRAFDIEVLDVVDTVVSKLKRFSASDISDIRAMVDLGRVDHATLIKRFCSAVDVFVGDARADDIPGYIRNLHRVERDFLLKPETPIELPRWVDD
jgi:hypothetical protein